MDTTKQAEVIDHVSVNGRSYRVNADHYCPELECWIYRDEHTGRLVTIPND